MQKLAESRRKYRQKPTVPYNDKSPDKHISDLHDRRVDCSRSITKWRAPHPSHHVQRGRQRVPKAQGGLPTHVASKDHIQGFQCTPRHTMTKDRSLLAALSDGGCFFTTSTHMTGSCCTLADSWPDPHSPWSTKPTVASKGRGAPRRRGAGLRTLPLSEHLQRPARRALQAIVPRFLNQGAIPMTEHCGDRQRRTKVSQELSRTQ